MPAEAGIQEAPARVVLHRRRLLGPLPSRRSLPSGGPSARPGGRSPGMTGGGEPLRAIRSVHTPPLPRPRTSRVMMFLSRVPVSVALASRGDGGRLGKRLRASGVSRRQIWAPPRRPPRWLSAFRSAPGAHGAFPPFREHPCQGRRPPALVSRRRRYRPLAVLRGPSLIPAFAGTASAKHPPPGLSGTGSGGGPRSRTRCRAICWRTAPAFTGGRVSEPPGGACETAARTPHPAPPTGRHR